MDIASDFESEDYGFEPHCGHRPRSEMDIASNYEFEDCGFDPHRGQ